MPKTAAMRIDLYTRCWNDARMLGFFFRHYDRLVSRYVVYDDGSTDDSLDLLRSNPKVEIRPTPPYSDPTSRVASGLAILESCWKESRGVADWVIVTDIDEHLHHPDLENYLKACKQTGVTVIPALGYEMLADEFPQSGLWLSQSLTMGAPSSDSSKLNIFAPDQIETTNYAVGRHTADPKGIVIAPSRDELLLLHYKFLGFERTKQRLEEYRTRQRQKDLEMYWGNQYSWSREQLMERWQQLTSRLGDISRPDLNPWLSHDEPRWWKDFERTVVGA